MPAYSTALKPTICRPLPRCSFHEPKDKNMLSDLRGMDHSAHNQTTSWTNVWLIKKTFNGKLLWLNQGKGHVSQIPTIKSQWFSTEKDHLEVIDLIQPYVMTMDWNPLWTSLRDSGHYIHEQDFSTNLHLQIILNQYTVYMLHKHTYSCEGSLQHPIEHPCNLIGASPGLAAAVTPNVGFLSLTLTDQQGSSACFGEVQQIILVDNLRQKEVAVGCDKVSVCIYYTHFSVFFLRLPSDNWVTSWGTCERPRRTEVPRIHRGSWLPGFCCWQWQERLIALARPVGCSRHRHQCRDLTPALISQLFAQFSASFKEVHVEVMTFRNFFLFHLSPGSISGSKLQGLKHQQQVGRAMFHSGNTPKASSTRGSEGTEKCYQISWIFTYVLEILPWSLFRCD